MQFGKAIGTACVSFAVTNIDDIFVLVTFFAESSTDKHLTGLRITIGQYVGFTVITVISLIGFGASLLFSPEPIGFLGLMPLLLGIWWMLALVFNRNKGEPETPVVGGSLVTGETADATASTGEANARDISVVARSATAAPVTSTTAAESTAAGETAGVGAGNAAQEKADPEPPATATAKARIWAKNIFKVASITTMNGGDNISTYVPLFSQAKGAEIAVYVVVYYILVGVWCLAAFLVMKQPHILRLARKYASRGVPFLYLGLGLYIIIKSDCYPWTIEKIDDEQKPRHPGTVIMAVVTAVVLVGCIAAMLGIKLRKRAARRRREAEAAAAAGSVDPVDPAALELGYLDNDPSSSVPSSSSPAPPPAQGGDRPEVSRASEAATNAESMKHLDVRDNIVQVGKVTKSRHLFPWVVAVRE